MPLYNNAVKPRTQFSLVHRSLLHSNEMLFGWLVSDERIAEIFAEERVVFGRTEDALYTPGATGGLSASASSDVTWECSRDGSYWLSTKNSTALGESSVAE